MAHAHLNPQSRARLIDALGSSPDVRKFDTSERTEAASLVYCFESLESGFRDFLDDHLPRLLKRADSGEDVSELLYEIGATLGQIAWHISLPKFYAYLEANTNNRNAV